MLDSDQVSAPCLCPLSLPLVFASRLCYSPLPQSYTYNQLAVVADQKISRENLAQILVL